MQKNVNDLLSQYTKLNNSFKKRLVFRLGMEAGFFSEYNNMILAMLYCLEHKIKFSLYSKDANFGYKEGWADYFLPFCEEVYHPIQKKYNHRYPGAYFSRKDRLKIKLYKIFHRVDYFTHEIWRDLKIHENPQSKHYYYPELGIDGDLNQACHVLVKMTWRYNDFIMTDIDEKMQSLSIPHDYVGIHVRKGDKILEQKPMETRFYIEKAQSLTSIRNAFISTDDYSIIEELSTLAPSWNILTLSDKNDHGYIYADFQKQDKVEIKKAHIKLFASIEVLSRADIFIGTFSSNPGMYLGMRMSPNKVFGLDSEKWQVW